MKRSAFVLASLMWGLVSCSGGSDPAAEMATSTRGCSGRHRGCQERACRGGRDPDRRLRHGERSAGAGVPRETDGRRGSASRRHRHPRMVGLNDNIRSMAEQLAGQGYRALAVDLYGGASASTPDEAQTLMRAALEKSGELTENLKQAYAYLSDGGQKVGTIGWCFGGGWSLQTALVLPEDIDATVIYYGRVVTEKAELEKAADAILGIFGAEDEGIPVDSVRAFESALKELGKNASIHIYEGANHAFANPRGRTTRPSRRTTRGRKRSRSSAST